jgi:hypothetical protein
MALIRFSQKTTDNFYICGLTHPPKRQHVILINDEKTRIVIPMHPGKDLKPGLDQSNN